MSENKTYVFGPIYSRRLGRSLGVDPIPMKTCTYNCIYCQLGRTPQVTTCVKEYIPLDTILYQIKDKLHTAPDYITIAGSGEPTLYSRLGDLIAGIKQIAPVPVAVITNGSIFFHKDIRESLKIADLVIPSLDAFDQVSFEKINRPESSINFSEMVNGLKEFSAEYKGHIWLEIFILSGFNDDNDSIEKLARIAGEINPERIQINTVSRPPAEENAFEVPYSRLLEIVKVFGPKAEIIAPEKTDKSESPKNTEVKDSDVLELIIRHPCTPDDIARGLSAPQNLVDEKIANLLSAGKIKEIQRDGKKFYLPE